MSKGPWKKGVVPIVVDVESDGPLLGVNSMVCFGAVVVNDGVGTKNELSFKGKTKPLSDEYDPDALAISGYTREEHENFPEIVDTMNEFKEWLDTVCNGRRPVFWSDNNSYDAAWINYYFLRFVGKNPFGYSSRRIGDLYCGFANSLKANREWKRLRKTSHTHDPLDDARGNAEALIEIFKQMYRRRESEIQ